MTNLLYFYLFSKNLKSRLKSQLHHSKKALCFNEISGTFCTVKNSRLVKLKLYCYCIFWAFPQIGSYSSDLDYHKLCVGHWAAGLEQTAGIDHHPTVHKLLSRSISYLKFLSLQFFAISYSDYQQEYFIMECLEFGIPNIILENFSESRSQLSALGTS